MKIKFATAAHWFSVLLSQITEQFCSAKLIYSNISVANALPSSGVITVQRKTDLFLRFKKYLDGRLETDTRAACSTAFYC